MRPDILPPSSPAIDATTGSSPGETVNSDGAAPSAGRSVARATLIIGAFHLVRLLIGFVSQPLIANRFGLSTLADVHTVATDIVSSIWLVFEKLVNPTVLPIFGRSLKEEGEHAAWRFAATTLSLTALVTALVAPLAWFAMPFIVDVYSQKADEQQRELTVAIARLLLAGLFFLSISSLTYVLLNGYKRFAAAALGDAGWKLGVLLAAVYAVVAKADPLASLYLLAYGFIVGAFLKLVPQAWALRDKIALLRARIDWRDPRLKAAALLALPLLIGVLTSEGRDVYRNYLADSPRITSGGEIVEGSRAALKFSRLIVSSLIQIFPYALSIGIFPFLVDMATEKDKRGFTDTLIGALRVCVFVFGPLTAILIAVRLPLLRAVWESGRFTAQDTLVLSAPFVAYALGMIGLACENVLNQSFYAHSRVWLPTIVGLMATAIFLMVATLGVESLGWGLAAIAGAESLSKTIKCVVMWRFLKPHLAPVSRREGFVFTLQVAIGSIAAAGVAGLLIQLLLPGDAEAGKIRTLLCVTLAGLAGTGAFLAFATLTRMREIEFLRRAPAALRRKMGR